MSKSKHFSANEKEDFLKFSTAHKRGILLLLILFLAILVITIIYTFLPRKKAQVDYKEFENQIAAYQQTLIEEQAKEKSRFDYKSVDYSAAETKLAPFTFNPNTLTAQEFEKMGLTPRQAQVILNYRNKGGKFRKKEDFKKMYCLSEKEYTILSPYIVIESENSYSKENQSYSKKTNTIVDLNKADSLDFQQLKGIGTVLSARIVKYRNLLGGFYAKKQLLEVYGLAPETVANIEPLLAVNEKDIRKINLNTADMNTLKKHPYVGYNAAKTIVKYREKNGAFTEVNQLLLLSLVDEQTFSKIKPYLIVE